MDIETNVLLGSTMSAFAERLEGGELFTFDVCPFPTPTADECAFLFEQRLAEHEGNRIALDPHENRVQAFVHHAAGQAERLRDLLHWCGVQALHWLREAMPRYAAAAELNEVAFHPEEEATRRLRLLDRNDLLHTDVPPAPSDGRRLLRLYLNLHPTDARVWQTSLNLAELMRRFGGEISVAAAAGGAWWQPLHLLRLLQPAHPTTAPFDEFMHQLHDFLKRHENFQERAPKKCWRFPPGAAWLAFTDGLSHAELRGRFVLEFAFLIDRAGLACPALAPISLFQNACSAPQRAAAA